MDKLILIAILVAAALGMRELSRYYDRVKKESGEGPKVEESAEPKMPSLPTPQLENSLQQAMAGGAAAFGEWISKYGQLAPEPRRAAIELDYAQMLVRSNPAEAKRVYEAVKARVGPDSLVYGRVKKMEKTFN